MPKRGGMSKLNIKSEEHRLELPDDAAPSFGMDIGNGQILPGLPVGESPPSLGKSSKALEGEVQGHQQATPPSESVTSDGIANPAGPSAVAESSMSITSSLVDEFRTPSILKNASSVQCPPSYISIPKSGSKTPSSLPTCSTSTLTLFPDDSVSNKGPRQTGRVQDNPKRLSRVSGISQCDSNFSETEAMDVDDTSSVAVTPSHAMSIDDEPQVLPLDLIRNICLSLEIDYSAGMSLDRVREQYVQRLQKFPNTQYTSDVSLDETLRTELEKLDLNSGDVENVLEVLKGSVGISLSETCAGSLNPTGASQQSFQNAGPSSDSSPAVGLATSQSANEGSDGLKEEGATCTSSGHQVLETNKANTAVPKSSHPTVVDDKTLPAIRPSSSLSTEDNHAN